MSFTIAKDEGDDFNATYHVRATISTRAEFEELIAKLTRYLASLAQEEHHDRIDHAIPVHPALAAHDSGSVDASAPPKEDGFIRSFRGE